MTYYIIYIIYIPSPTPPTGPRLCRRPRLTDGLWGARVALFSLFFSYLFYKSFLIDFSSIFERFWKPEWLPKSIFRPFFRMFFRTLVLYQFSVIFLVFFDARNLKNCAPVQAGAKFWMFRIFNVRLKNASKMDPKNQGF